MERPKVEEILSKFTLQRDNSWALNRVARVGQTRPVTMLGKHLFRVSKQKFGIDPTREPIWVMPLVEVKAIQDEIALEFDSSRLSPDFVDPSGYDVVSGSHRVEVCKEDGFVLLFHLFCMIFV